MPRGFESGLRYLAPALVLGLALLPVTPILRARLASPLHPNALRPRIRRDEVRSRWTAATRGRVDGAGSDRCSPFWRSRGYPIQRHYLQNRYANPSFTTPGLDAAFAWASAISGARIATTSTRQYPLFGTDLSNRVAYIGIERPHGGFEAAKTCRAWRQSSTQGHYDYVVATRDRIEPGKPPYPPQASWTEGPGAKVVLRKPPTVVFQLNGPLDPSACP